MAQGEKPEVGSGAKSAPAIVPPDEGASTSQSGPGQTKVPTVVEVRSMSPAPAAMPDAEDTVAQQEDDVAKAKALSQEIHLPAPAKTDESKTEGQSAAQRSLARRLSQGLIPPPLGYQLREKLGEGTYGVVFRAQEVTTGIEVAIKYFLQARGQEWQSLTAEVKQLAMLQADPGIVQLKDVDAESAPPYYVMAYYESGCLRPLVHSRQPLPVDRALAIVRQVTETLAYVHAKGVRHCDLKPGNVLLDARGRAYVADFGQAHLSSDVTPALGTFFYMAPEQATLQKQIPDTRWDVYGLGALLYALICGRPPRQTPEVQEELANTAELSHRLARYRQRVDSAPPLREHRKVKGMDRQLADLIERCLAPDPQQRPHDAGAVLAELERRDDYRRQRPFLVFALVAPLILLGCLFGFGFWQAHNTLRTAQQALEENELDDSLVSARFVALEIERLFKEKGKLMQESEKRLDAQTRQWIDTAGRTDGVEKLKHNESLTKILSDLREGFVKARSDASDRQDRWRFGVFDKKGFLLALAPTAAVVGRDYSRRDYFHGRGEQEGKTHYPPITEPHVSEPYWGEATGDLMMVFSTPVRDDQNDVIGVLTLHTPFEWFVNWIDKVGIQKDIVIVNDKRQVLSHKQLERTKGEKPRAYSSGTVFDDAVRSKGRRVYVDPVTNAECIGGFAPFTDLKQRKMGVLVQRERAEVLKPVEALRREMVIWGLMALTTAAGLFLALWLGLLRVLQRRGSVVHG